MESAGQIFHHHIMSQVLYDYSRAITSVTGRSFYTQQIGFWFSNIIHIWVMGERGFYTTCLPGN